MTSEEDEEVEMVMQQKSRFSRYRSRVREKINSDINEAMSIDDANDVEYVHFFYCLKYCIHYFNLIELMIFILLNNEMIHMLRRNQ